MEKRISFELFKSNVCHRVKELGDLDFLIQTLKADTIRKYFLRRWYPESLYLLAMVDYLSRVNDLPLCSEYRDLRICKLQRPSYPASILALSEAAKNDAIKEEARAEAIPEFMRFNIVESDIRNVV